MAEAPASFASLGIENFLIKRLEAMAIRSPTTVQTACIPPILAGRDCIGNAQTGSGKTMAFALPILQSLAKDPFGFFALILTPTRELAFQIHEQFTALGASFNLHSTVIVGGLDMMTQANELRKRPHVIIATPGRLVDLMHSSAGEWSFSRTRFLVLDEADRMLAPSFASELSVIVKQLPQERQTLLFTATMSDAIMALRNKEPSPGKEKPFVHLSNDLVSTPATLKQQYVFVPSTVRDTYLYYLLRHLPSLTGARARPAKVKTQSDSKPRKSSRSEPSYRTSTIAKDDDDADEPIPQSILFVSRCRIAAHLSELFSELDIPNVALHSHLSQKQRLASLSSFRASSVPLLIATDVGSRGLDIPEVDVVVNWDLPREPDDYVHRVGRTARAGKKGVAISIITEGDVDLVQAIETRVGASMTELALPEERVLESLNKVSTAQRIASMTLRSEKVGEKQEINKKKQKLAQKEFKRRVRDKHV